MNDTDPHRRNIVVTSLLFVVYFAGGGELADNEYVKMAFINVQLSRPWAVGFAAWAMLIWFGFRYGQKSPPVWQEIKSDLKDIVPLHFQQLSKNDTTLKVQENNKVKFITPQPRSITSLLLTGRQLRNAPMMYSSGSASSGMFSKITDREPPIKSRWFYFVQGWAIRRKAILGKHAFADWFVPWVLFWVAMLVAYIELIKAILP